MTVEFEILKPYADKIEQGLVKDLLEIPGAIMAEQIHTDNIVELADRPVCELRCDAFMTQQKDLPLMVKVADCQGLLIYDPENSAIASVHSGWRGSALNIIGKTIRKMKQKYESDPSMLLVAISPSLGPCCAEFTDPKNELPAFMHRFILPNNHVDFWGLSLEQLKLEGVQKKNIELSGRCTKCQPGYYSHRNGDSQRQGIFVKLK